MAVEGLGTVVVESRKAGERFRNETDDNVRIEWFASANEMTLRVAGRLSVRR